jgi:hypothetical protein
MHTDTTSPDNTTDTAAPKHWSPLRPLLIIGLWLATLVLIAFAMAGGCGGATPTPPATGSISLTWSITDLAGQPATCDQVGACSVALRLTDRTGSGVVAVAFPCSASSGTTSVAVGVYDIAIELHTADGTKLATAPPQNGVAIATGPIRRLMPVAFAATTSESLVLSIATPTAENCQSTTAGGAGITAMAITLAHTGDGCAPLTFVRMQGGAPHGTYTVDCSTPMTTTCIENTETLTTSLGPGSYTVHVTGKINAADCWQRDDTLQIPPPGKPLVHTVDLVHQALAGC